ncbi:MAG: PEP-CTERM sorting domain-containing protein, partial [Planctomycetes bacterium]|nr:PEP-CTERM sorting domain-containing protein [Planctomycetota bacterium]
MNGNTVTAQNIQFAGNGQGGITRTLATETMTATNQLYVGERSQIQLIAGDSATNIYMDGSFDGLSWSTLSTAATSNVTDNVQNYGGDLTLGANMVLASQFSNGGSNGRTGLLIMNGFSVTAQNINFGGNGAGASDGTGSMFANSLQVFEGSTGRARGGVIDNSINVQDGGNTFQVLQASGQLNGLTLDNANNNALNLNTLGVLNLAFDNAFAGGALAGDPANFDWAFRWKGDNVATLQGLFGSGNLTVTGAAGFNPLLHIFWTGNGGGIEDDYTYVGFLAAQEEPNGVPEPSTFVLAALGLAGLGLLARR